MPISDYFFYFTEIALICILYATSHKISNTFFPTEKLTAPNCNVIHNVRFTRLDLLELNASL